MTKKIKNPTKQAKDPQDHPISKKKTLTVNMNSYIRMLKLNFPNISSKQFIKNIHRFINKVKRKLKSTQAKKAGYIRQKIKICKQCDDWSGTKPMKQCNICQDNFHQQCGSGEQLPQGWHCSICIKILEKKQVDKNKYLQKFKTLDTCQKCQIAQKQFETFIICLKCNHKYHKNCYGKAKVVCYKCDMTIEKQIKQKQASLFDFKFSRKTQSNCKNNNTEKKNKKQQLQFFGKNEKFEDEATQTSTRLTPTFSKNYPKMSEQQIENYKKQLLYAIRSKQMIHVQQLMPINCQLYEDTEETLDFGLDFMTPTQQSVYKKYKQQPFGPFKFIYSKQMGYDVVADKDLPSGMLVCEYVGDVVTFREIIQQELTQQHNDSLFQLTAGKTADQTLYIRPAKYTNMARFINGVNSKTGRHKINVQSIRKLAKGKPGIFLYTTRNIKKGQSLYYDYNAGIIQAYPTDQFL